MPDKDPAQTTSPGADTSTPLHESPLGRNFVGLSGVLGMTAYLVLVGVLAFYTIVKVWPPDAASGQTASSAWQVSFFWSRGAQVSITSNTSLFLIVILMGAVGSLLHSLRSLYWYAGNRKLIWSWAAMYMLLPWSGGVLAAIFYVVIRAGFLPQAGTQGQPPTTPYGFAALGALVGLFSEEAILKLKQVAETVFAKADQGKDRAVPAPKVTSIAPNSGPSAGGTPVIITGTGFAAGAGANIGGAPAASAAFVSTTSIHATTVRHEAGRVDVEVVNPDGQKDTLTGAYTYMQPN
jgi:hypothetical protein